MSRPGQNWRSRAPESREKSDSKKGGGYRAPRGRGAAGAASSSSSRGGKHGHNADTKRPLRATLFSSSDPIRDLEQLVSMETSSLLVKELAKGGRYDEDMFLDTMVSYCNCEEKNTETRKEIASLLLNLLSRESFLESTQQSSVNTVLEAILPTGLFTPDKEFRLGSVLVSCTEPGFVSNMCRLLKALLERFPLQCMLQMGKLFKCFSSMQGGPAEFSSLKSRFSEMRREYEMTGEAPKPQRPTFVQKQALASVHRYHELGDPDENTFIISSDAMPKPEEMENLDKALAVRTNRIVNGEIYTSISEYLDTQFRLLRSDALSGIRFGLQAVKEARVEYEKRLADQNPRFPAPPFRYPKHDSYYAYYDMSAIDFAHKEKCGANSLAYVMSFVPVTGSARPIDWSTSKRLIPGSLVVLSADRFKTLIWGTVGIRDEELLKKGLCSIAIHSASIGRIVFTSKYEMLETSALWTAYEPVLKCLAHLFENQHKFPMPDLLIGEMGAKNEHQFTGPWYIQRLGQRNVKAHHLEPYLLWSEERIRSHHERQVAKWTEDLNKKRLAKTSTLKDEMVISYFSARLGLPPPPPPSLTAEAPENDQLNDKPSNDQIKKKHSIDDQSNQPIQSNHPNALASHDKQSSAESSSKELPSFNPLDANAPLTYPGSWLTYLDPSQWEAMRMILTQRLSVIQGPPGTGKTFIGLKATEILLKQQGFEGPILCVCYTNHALDQFLEEVYKFEKSVVRIGGRSKSEILKERTLHHLQPYINGGSLLADAYTERDELRKEVQKAMKALSSPGRCLEHFWDWIGFPPREGKIRRASSSFYLNFNEENPKSDLIAFYKLFNATPIEPPVSSSSAFTPMPTPSRRELMAQVVAAESEDTESVDDSDEEFDLALFLEPQDRDEQRDAGIHGKAEKRFLDRNSTQEAIYALCEGATVDLDYLEEEACEFSKDQFLQFSLAERKGLLLTWLTRLSRTVPDAVQELIERFSQVVDEINTFKEGNTVDFLREQRVIGLTTTGAAKNAAVIQALNPRVVIVEEAAEIFEAHVIACLTASVEKVILIGDHQQLRPKITHYPLTKRGLDISLFERLIKAGMPHVTLRQQHRMHPEISRFITPIYPNLINGPKTALNRLDATTFGFSNRVIFFAHNWKEQGGNDEEIASKTNPLEAIYIFGLVRYLLTHGVSSKDITVIAMYQGQNRLLRRFFRVQAPGGMTTPEMLQKALKEVKICCVDDYQGEENEIVIVSLVRSNAEGSIGFVRTPNRVCVALSRAKSMMFVFGSADTIMQDANRKAKEKPHTTNFTENLIWPPILTMMQEAGVFVNELTLTCTVHPSDEKSKTTFNEPKSWQQSISACRLPCGVQFDCGHWCKVTCHGKLPHPRCDEPCQRIFDACHHPCPKRCYEACDDCMVPTVIGVPRCGHSITVACHKQKDPHPFCNHPCPRTHPCGHACPKMCGQQCGPCYERIEWVVSQCGHTNQGPCCKGHSSLCNLPCPRTLPCGHSCPSKCGQQCEPCHERIEWVVSQCGHTNQGPCCKGRSSLCNLPCPLTLPCGHSCPGKCGRPCQPCTDIHRVRPSFR